MNLRVVCFIVYIDKMISHLQSYSAALDPTSLHVYLFNSLQWQSSLNDGMPHDQRYHRTDVVILITHCSLLVCNRGDHHVPNGHGADFKR